MPSCSKSCVISCARLRHFFLKFLLSICHVSESVKLYLSNLYVFIDFLPALFGFFSLDLPGFRWKNKQQFCLYGPRERKFRKQKEKEREREKEKSVSVSLFFFVLLPPLFLFIQTRSNLNFFFLLHKVM